MGGKVAHAQLEMVGVKSSLFEEHQDRCVCLTLPCLQFRLPSPSTHGKLGFHRLSAPELAQFMQLAFKVLAGSSLLPVL